MPLHNSNMCADKFMDAKNPKLIIVDTDADVITLNKIDFNKSMDMYLLSY